MKFEISEREKNHQIDAFNLAFIEIDWSDFNKSILRDYRVSPATAATAAASAAGF